MLLEYIKKYEKGSIVTSILMIIVSILLIAMPETVLDTAIMAVAIMILVGGIIHIVSYIITDKEMKVFSSELFQGILAVISSVVMLKFKSSIMSVVPIVVGVLVIIESIMKFQLAFNLRGVDKGWFVLLIVSVVYIGLGVLVIVKPFDTVVAVTVASGVVLLITEVCNLVESLCVLRKLK